MEELLRPLLDKLTLLPTKEDLTSLAKTTEISDLFQSVTDIFNAELKKRDDKINVLEQKLNQLL